MPRVTPRKLLQAIVLVALLLVVGVLAGGAYCAVALPGCASCHDHGSFATATLASSHAKVACASCHVPADPVDRFAYGYRELGQMVLRLAPPAGPDAAAVPDARCAACHANIARGVVSAGGIKIAHSTCAKGTACTDCHSTVAHGTATAWVKVYDMETCLACHVSKASTACDLCHEGRRPADRVTSGVFAVTHGPQWRTTHGLGNTAVCTACHTPSSCVKCHGPGVPHDASFLTEHGSVSVQAGAKCASCHETQFCTDCHGLTMPHPTQFTRSHAAEATSDPALCQRCHVKSDCENCHVSHVHPGSAVSLTGSATVPAVTTP